MNPILGAQRSNTLPYIVTEMEGGILTAQNTYNGEYSGLLLFLGATEPFEQIQPGSSLKIAVTLPARETKKICLKLGCGRGMEQIGRLCGKYDDWTQIEQEFFGVQRYWDSLTRAVTVQTPDESMNLMLNGWLLYQTLSCRMLARSAFYQSGGAYGYRDQLQDSLAFLHVESGITRRQILLHAAHQFLQGDVQHWWHENPKPEGGMADKGIRTRFSDDLLWLPYVCLLYTSDVYKRHRQKHVRHCTGRCPQTTERHLRQNVGKGLVSGPAGGGPENPASETEIYGAKLKRNERAAQTFKSRAVFACRYT